MPSAPHALPFALCPMRHALCAPHPHISAGKSTACPAGIFSDGTKGFKCFDFALTAWPLLPEIGFDFLLLESGAAFGGSSVLFLTFSAKSIGTCFSVLEGMITICAGLRSAATTLIPGVIGELMINIDTAAVAMFLMRWVFIVAPCKHGYGFVA